MWDKLSMAEKARIIALGVQSGITDLNIIRQRYNSFARGGYTKWKEKISKHKRIKIDNDPDYDYEGFYNSNSDRAWDMLNKSSKAHFTDEFKYSSHPSFSNGSRYSGYKNKHNPNGITGGTWIDDYNYQLSQSQFDNDWDTDRTLDYFEKAESHPVNLYAPDGSTILRGITVTPQSSALDRDYSNKYDIGGGLRKRIRSALGKSTNRQATRINTRQFQSSNVEQVDRTNVKRVNPSQVQDKIQDNQNKAVAYQILERRYPQAVADGMDYEGLVNLDKSTTPVSFNGKVYVGSNYQPQEVSYSQDNKSNQEHKQAQNAFIQNQEQQRKEDEIKQTVELLNNPYNPIGQIPGLRSVVNAGADQNYSRAHNTASTPYTTDAAFSTAGDAITLGFGLGPLKNYAGSYAGTIAGDLIGEQFDNPQLGQIIGGITGGFSPQIYNTSKKFLSNKFSPYLLARTMNSSLKSAQISPELHPIRTDFNLGKGSGRVLRADKGDARGLFTGQGAYTQNGFLYPGKTRMEGQRDFTWWNEDELFSSGFNKKPHQRVFIANKSDIPGLQRVREMNEAVGQWRPGRKSFVRKSEMVTAEPIDISNLTQYNYDPNLGIYVRSDVQTHNLSLSQLNPQNTPKTNYSLYERPSKLTSAERAGIPKGERNNTSKPLTDFRQMEFIDHAYQAPPF